MLLIEKTKFGFSFYRGHEFNDVSRHKIWVLRFLWFSLIHIHPSSDISNTFNASHMTNDLSWVNAVKEDKQRWKDHYEKYWYDQYMSDFEYFKGIIDDRDKKLQQYKEVTGDLKNLARVVRKIKLFDMKKLDDL